MNPKVGKKILDINRQTRHYLFDILLLYLLVNIEKNICWIIKRLYLFVYGESLS